MRITLIEKQIDMILKALENYSKSTSEKQLLYATYESLLAQKTANAVTKTNYELNKNVI